MRVVFDVFKRVYGTKSVWNRRVFSLTVDASGRSLEIRVKPYCLHVKPSSSVHMGTVENHLQLWFNYEPFEYNRFARGK